MMINGLLHCFSISIQAEFIMGKLSFLLSIHTSLQGSGIFNILPYQINGDISLLDLFVKFLKL